MGQGIYRVSGNTNSQKYQEILTAHYIPNHKRVHIVQQDGAPSYTSASMNVTASTQTEPKCTTLTTTVFIKQSNKKTSPDGSKVQNNVNSE